MPDFLFDVPAEPEPEPAPTESATVRRTRRQAAMLAAGIHPLSAVLSVKLRLHAEAAPYGDRQADGRRCGNCRFRELLTWRSQTLPKCTYGARMTHGAASDVRAYWSACVDHQWKETDD